jgi:hypothetical protein
MLGLREHAQGPIQRFHQNFTEVLANYVVEVLANYAYILTIWLHLEIMSDVIHSKAQ